MNISIILIHIRLRNIRYGYTIYQLKTSLNEILRDVGHLWIKKDFYFSEEAQDVIEITSICFMVTSIDQCVSATNVAINSQ